MSLKISIITPSLNSSRYIEEAIVSVLQQGYDYTEHIIVDGGSTDGTIDILKKYPHLKWVSEPDSGQPNAMNKGFGMSTGDIIGYLNADDYYLPGAFHAVLPWFEKGSSFVVGKVNVLMDDGSSWINDARVSHTDMLKHWEPEAFCVNSSGYFYKREVQEKAGGFNENNRFAMDLEFLLDASKYYELKKIDAMLGVFRFIAGTITSKSQGAENTWTRKNFKFVDRFLEGIPEDVCAEYEKQRTRGYLTRQCWQYEEKLREFEKKNQTRKLTWLARLLEKKKEKQIRNKISGLKKEIESI